LGKYINFSRPHYSHNIHFLTKMGVGSGIDRDAIPGTVHLVDVDGTSHAMHSKGHDDIILVPTPSKNPDDPLNWSPGRKALSTFCNFT